MPRKKIPIKEPEDDVKVPRPVDPNKPIDPNPKEVNIYPFPREDDKPQRPQQPKEVPLYPNPNRKRPMTPLEQSLWSKVNRKRREKI